MCMLCVIPPNVIPDRDKLENSALNNPHGYGFAIAIPSEKRILVRKTMNADESINEFIKFREMYPEGYAMWHARFATHGDINIANCHPFKVDEAGHTWIAHNGILSTLEDKSGRSDTAIFAEDVLANMGGIHALDNDQIFNIIEEFSRGSKLAILSVDPAAQYQCYIIHKESGWVDDKDVWWSNHTCDLGYGYGGGKYKYADDYDWEVDDFSYYKKESKADNENFLQCEFCESYTDENAVYDLHNGYCPVCGGCFECNSDMDGCMCWNGSGPKNKDEHQSWNDYYAKQEIYWAEKDREAEEKGRVIALEAIRKTNEAKLIDKQTLNRELALKGVTIIDQPKAQNNGWGNQTDAWELV